MSEFDNKLSAENLIARFAPNNEEELTDQEKSESFSKQENSEVHDLEKNIDWHKLAHKLREHNRKLLKKVFQLEQEIIEVNQSLAEKEKSLASNSLYAAKQAEKINRYEEEIADFSQKVIDYEQETHIQKATIEGLTLQLETSEQKTNQLDEEFIQLRNAIVEKDLALSNKVEAIKELQIRLERQKYQFAQPQAEIVTPERTDVSFRNEPIRAWSASYGETNLAKQVSTQDPKYSKEQEQVSQETEKHYQPIQSIAAVKLPQFSRYTN